MPVVGFVNAASPQPYARMSSAFLKGLSETSYVENQNVKIEYRWAQGEIDRLPAFAADLVHRQVAVIAATGTPAALAAKAATTTIPIVFETGSDPVQLGLVTSLNRPGGNVTGVTQLGVEVAPKRLEVLHELIPTTKIIALLVDPTDPAISEKTTRGVQAAAQSLGLELHVLNVSTERDLDAVFANLIQLRAGGVVISGGHFFNSRSKQLAARALQHAVPTIFPYRDVAAATGGLIQLRSEPCRCLSPCRHLHRPSSQGREAGGFTGPAGNESRADHQSRDGQGARHNRAAVIDWPRRRGDRVNGGMSAIGT
jgi:putative ABC transport system substrate-binding protein